MRTIEKIEMLYQYYLSTRNIGHTSLLKEGAKRFKKDFFILSFDHDNRIFEAEKSQIVSWSNLKKLIGHQKPMIIDNGAMVSILSDVLNEMHELEEENQRLKETLASPMNEILKKHYDLKETLKKLSQ